MSIVYVFKTNVKNKYQIKKLKPIFNSCFPHVQWNFDIEDCDKIFRVESQVDIVSDISKIFKSKGYDCEELAD